MLDPIDRLVAAYAEAEVPPLPPAGDVSAVLAEIRTAIAPLRLPPGVERCLRRIAPHARTMAPTPRLESPAGALEQWRRHRATTPQITPALLWPVCREGRRFLFVELDDGGGSAGTCFEWGGAGRPFEITFVSFPAYLDLWAAMVESQEFVTVPVAGRERHMFDPQDRWRDARRVRLRANLPLPRYGEQLQVDCHPRYWPSHWLLSNSLVPASRAAVVVVTDLIDLVRRARDGRDVIGTVRARVTGIAGSSEGRQAVIDDGTARVDVWLPASVCTTEPEMHREFEFDIVVKGSVALRRTDDLSGSLRDLMWSGTAGDPADVSRTRRLFDLPHGAEATAIRPVR